MSDDEKELDLTSPEVVTKYKLAAETVNSIFSAFSSTYTYLCVCMCVLLYSTIAEMGFLRMLIN